MTKFDELPQVSVKEPINLIDFKIIYYDYNSKEEQVEYIRTSTFSEAQRLLQILHPRSVFIKAEKYERIEPKFFTEKEIYNISQKNDYNIKKIKEKYNVINI